MIPKIIKERTLRGSFAAKGSSGGRARRYDPRYARKVGKSVGGPVDLFITGQLHDGIKGKARFGKNTISATGYIAGGGAKTKYNHLQVQGVGPNLIKRRFMYLNKKEAGRVARAMIRAAAT